MSRSRAFSFGLMVAALSLSPTLVGCAFKKATPMQVSGGGDDGSGNGDGGPDIMEVGLDIIAPPMSDSGPFASDVMLNCIEANPQTMNLPPDILLVLDRSGSMQDDLTGATCRGGCGANSKWTIATTTIEAFLPTVETTVNWGLKLFASTANGTGCMVSNTAEIPPAAMNAAAMSAQLATTMPGSATPTTAAMTAAAAYLMGLNDSNPKFILLATDGIPTCGSAACAPGVTAGANQCDDANAIAAVAAAKTLGISTFVLGIGTANSPGDATLSSMAAAGGFPRSSSPSYYPIGSAQDLSDAFKAVTGMAGSCFFAVTPVPKDATAIKGVTGDGNPISRDPTDGWTFVNMGSMSGVQLNGKSCDDYKNKVIVDVKVQLPCVEG